MAGGSGERIFVYGTLRRGGTRDGLKYFRGAEFVSAARVRGVLYDLGDYPGLRLDERAGWVRGELFDVDAAALAGMDDWEGIDPAAPAAGEYRRVRAAAERDDGGSAPCWVYEISAARVVGGAVIPSGDWLAREARS